VKENNMAKGLNYVILVGAIAKPPELRHTPSKIPVVSFTLAGEDNIMDSDGNAHYIPWYYRVSFFGKQAEEIAILEPGTPVTVEGALEYNTWEKDDQKHSSITIKARRVEITETGARTEATIPDSAGGLRLTDALNYVAAIGNLTSDAEFTNTTTEKPLVKFDIAINESYKDAKGEWQETTVYIAVRYWKDQSDLLKHYKKGSPVMVIGRLAQSSWTDKEERKRQSTQIEVNRIEFLAQKSKT
jgi:single-strand DNA-binding protein